MALQFRSGSTPGVRRTLAALSFASILLFSVVGQSLAASTANCSDALPKNHWKGERVLGAKHGTSGTFEAQTLAMCTNPGFPEVSSSFVWSNVVGTGTNDIAQTGWGVCRSPWPPDQCSTSNKYLWAWGRDSSGDPGCSGYSDVAPTPSSTTLAWDGLAHDYKVYHKTNYWRFYVGNTQVYAIPESAICWTPTAAVWFGENWDSGDAIGGYAGSHSTHFTMSSMNYANSEDGGFFWTNLSGVCNYGDPAPYYCSIYSTTAIDLWTSR